MWWYGSGWWWWWIAFLLLFFLLPLGYGWGYRGWGPWYRRRAPATGPPHYDVPARTPAEAERMPRAPGEADVRGWGWAAAVLWIALVIAIVWFFAALVFGAR